MPVKVLTILTGSCARYNLASTGLSGHGISPVFLNLLTESKNAAIACANPASFVRGDPTLIKGFFRFLGE